MFQQVYKQGMNDYRKKIKEKFHISYCKEMI